MPSWDHPVVESQGEQTASVGSLHSCNGVCHFCPTTFTVYCEWFILWVDMYMLNNALG